MKKNNNEKFVSKSSAKQLGAKNNDKYVLPPEYGIKMGVMQYQMTQDMANHLLSIRKGADRNKDIQKYLCDVVNAEFGLKQCCTKVVIV